MDGPAHGSKTEAAGPRFICVDCGILSPDVSDVDGSSLITLQYGWRIKRRFDERGEAVIEARCATCWSKFRAKRGTP